MLVQMREKATKEGLNVRIVSYNLGGESKCPDGALPGIWAKYGIEFREFNFAKYPSHVANLHCYAWKPPIIDEVLQESSENTVVMWVDSGATVVMSLRKVIDLTKKTAASSATKQQKDWRASLTRSSWTTPYRSGGSRTLLRRRSRNLEYRAKVSSTTTTASASRSRNSGIVMVRSAPT